MGALFVLISAIGFGSMALFANMAYADGVDTFSLLTLRFVIAASLLGALAVVRGARFPRGRALRSYAGMGVVYTAMAWGYFGALHHAPSATVALVLYVYPILVALAAFALRLDRFGWPEAGTLVLSSLGLYLVLGGSTQGSGTGLLLAFVAAVCYSGYILIGSRKHMEGGRRGLFHRSLEYGGGVLFCALFHAGRAALAEQSCFLGCHRGGGGFRDCGGDCGICRRPETHRPHPGSRAVHTGAGGHRDPGCRIPARTAHSLCSSGRMPHSGCSHCADPGAQPAAGEARASRRATPE